MASDNVGDANELKQQGAIETAQNATSDPESNVRPEDVEKVILDETKKAGMPAYQFNPDASLEEKAAMTQAVGAPWDGCCWVLGEANSCRVARTPGFSS